MSELVTGVDLPNLIDLNDLTIYDSELKNLVSNTYATKSEVTTGVSSLTSALSTTNTNLTNLVNTSTNADATLENSLNDLSDSVDIRFTNTNTSIQTTNTNLGTLNTEFTTYKSSNDSAISGINTSLNSKCNEPVIVTTTLDEILTQYTPFIVPEHTISSNRLQVFVDGILCHRNIQYNDMSATTIAFTSDLEVGTEITIYRY